MLFLDSIFNYRSTEPIWFRFFRGFFAITLTTTIIYYSITQFQKINTEASTVIKFEDYSGIHLTMNISTGINNELIIDRYQPRHFNILIYDISEYTPFFKTIRLQMNRDSVGRKYLPSLERITFKPNNNYSHMYPNQYPYPMPSEFNFTDIPDDLLFLSFESIRIERPSNKTYISLFNSSYYYDENFDSYVTLEQTYLSLNVGQAFYISFDPIIITSDTFDDGGGRKKLYKLALNPKLEQLPIKFKSNETRFGIYLRSGQTAFSIEKTTMYDYTDLISNLGGFYSGIAGLFYLIFGMQKHKPWGLAQKYFFSCTPFRKSLKRNFARKYVSSAGIPLVEKVNKRPEGSSLEERVQILETLLQDYYLDDYYLKKVKEVRIKHKKSIKKYNEISQQSNDSNDDTKLDLV